MKIKSWGQYLIKIVLILLLVYGTNSIFRVIDLREGLTYILQVWNRTAIALIFYGGIGIILGLNHFTVEMRKKGVWRADWPKLIMLGVPSLFYAFSFAISVYGGPVFGPIPYILAKQLIIDNHGGIICLFSLILGHTIITGFYKYDATHNE